MMLVQTMRGGGDPMQLLQKMAGQNPQAAQALKMIQGKNPQQLKTMAENMAKERGVSINDIARQLGINNPSNRQIKTPYQFPGLEKKLDVFCTHPGCTPV